MSRSTSKGEYRVGISFNPSGNVYVDAIKTQAANLIDTIEAIPQPEGVETGEFRRLTAHAQTLVEDAAMNAVKAATKRPPGE